MDGALSQVVKVVTKQKFARQPATKGVEGNKESTAFVSFDTFHGDPYLARHPPNPVGQGGFTEPGLRSASIEEWASMTRTGKG